MNNKIDLSCVTLAFLAGGVGKRMGMPKANLVISGKPILEWIMNRLRWPGPTMLVTTPAVNDAPGLNRFDQHCTDPIDGLGPARGILTALENARTSMACVATVDMPLVEMEQFEQLVQTLISGNQILGAMFNVNNLNVTSTEPFPSAFKVEAAPLIRLRIEEGQRSVHGLCDTPSICSIISPVLWPPEVWTNLNTPADMKHFLNSQI